MGAVVCETHTDVDYSEKERIQYTDDEKLGRAPM